MRDIRTTLTHAVTEWDRKQAKRKGYNRYALAQYLCRVDDVVEDVTSRGMPLAKSLALNFNDRLLSHLERACGLAVAD